MPFEAEVGLHPSLEDMQDVVVTRKQRPKFSDTWLQDAVSLHNLLWLYTTVVIPLTDHLAVSTQQLYTTVVMPLMWTRLKDVTFKVASEVLGHSLDVQNGFFKFGSVLRKTVSSVRF